RNRKIPRGDHERDAARPVMVITFFTGDLLSKLRSSKSAHLLRVESAEIDGLADVGVGFGPRFGNFKNFDSRAFIAAPIQNVGRPLEQTCPLFKRRPSPCFECCSRSLNGALGFGNSCFGSVTDNLGRLARINRWRQIIGPNLFASDVERMFFAEALARLA